MPIPWLRSAPSTASFTSVRLLAVDIDGTLTDALLHDGGKDALGWTQTYHVRDGEAVKRLAAAGTPVVPISRNKTRCARERMDSLGLPTQWVGVSDKVQALRAVLAHYGVPAAAAAYVGDGPEDIAVFCGVGLGCAVADADERLLNVADFVSRFRGGRGAVADVANRILEANEPGALRGPQTMAHQRGPALPPQPSANVFAAGALAGALVLYSAQCAGKNMSSSSCVLALTSILTAATACVAYPAWAAAPSGHATAPPALASAADDTQAFAAEEVASEPLHPGAEAYLRDRGEFRLDHLVTEQRHPKTWSLSSLVGRDTEAGLRQLWSVDDDIEALVQRLRASPAVLDGAAQQVEFALLNGHRILLYGCGSTGRLAKTLESLWRQAFERADGLHLQPRNPSLYAKLRSAVVGEITGGDRALISSLEGFEDLAVVGELQLASHGYQGDDVVFAISEGGETSSVLGLLAAARKQQGAANGRTFFVYNNPAESLQKLGRSRAALDDAGVTHLNLTTGPQAIAGSTRMQATSSELLVVGTLLEHALARTMARALGPEDLAALKLDPALSVSERLGRFGNTLAAVRAQAPALSQFTDAETAAYAAGHRATYRADRALATVFTDATERSPTFRLAPIDRIAPAKAPAVGPTPIPARRAWLHVASGATDGDAAWRRLLGRPFRGLDVALFEGAISERVQDSDLLAAATRSLAHAGPEEGEFYDLSAHSLSRPGWIPLQDDFYLTVSIDNETWTPPPAPGPRGPEHYELNVTDATTLPRASHITRHSRSVRVEVPSDGLDLHKNLAVKLLLNAHSTAVMCKMGRVVGNTMAFVQPSNLKLIGRATFLIQSHMNDVLNAHQAPHVSYEEANSLLFEAIDAREQLASSDAPSEVGLAIAMGTLRRLLPGRAWAWRDCLQALPDGNIERFKEQAQRARPDGSAMNPEAAPQALDGGV